MAGIEKCNYSVFLLTWYKEWKVWRSLASKPDKNNREKLFEWLEYSKLCFVLW